MGKWHLHRNIAKEDPDETFEQRKNEYILRLAQECHEWKDGKVYYRTMMNNPMRMTGREWKMFFYILMGDEAPPELVLNIESNSFASLARGSRPSSMRA